MLSRLLFVFFFSGVHIVSAQLTELPKEAKPFVLKGHEMLDYEKGDINADGLEDAILILKNPGEDSIFDERLPRPLLILIRQKDGKLKQVVRNDKAIMGRHDGGMFGDPWQGMDVYKGGFGLAFYGGSSWRWAYHYEFKWNSIKKTWLLTKEESSSFNSGDMEATMKNTEIGATELGEVPITTFSSEAGYEDSRWKVNVAKTFFYENPKLGSAPRKGYLVRGNTVTGIRQLKNFVEVSYENSKGEITTGFVLKKDLLKLK